MSIFSTTKMGLFISLVLIIISALVAVVAYSNATIINPAVIKIVSTNDALLSLSSYNDPCELVTTTSKGLLSFNFNFDNKNHQEFNFDELFKIKNNSTDNVKVTIESDGVNYISLQPSTSSIYFVVNGINKGNYYDLSSGEKITIKVSFTIPENTSQVEIDGVLRVKAVTR